MVVIVVKMLSLESLILYAAVNNKTMLISFQIAQEMLCNSV